MTTAVSPNPKNLIVLGLVGIGVYWLMTRGKSAFAQTVPMFPTPQQNKQYAAYSAKDAALWGGVAKLLGKGTDALFNANWSRNAESNGKGADVYTGATAGDPYNSDFPSNYYSSAADAVAWNPTSGSPWDENGPGE